MVLTTAQFVIDGWLGMALLWVLPLLLTVCTAVLLRASPRDQQHRGTDDSRSDRTTEHHDEPQLRSRTTPQVFGVFGSSRAREDHDPGVLDDALVANIDQARETWTSGEVSEGQHLLQQVIVAARQRKDMRVEAQARMELAAIAEAEGDRTSACEHFQIARQLYLDAQAHKHADAVDARMRQLGCPSGWVLEGF